MKTKFDKILILLLVFMVKFAFAQVKTISGVVSDEMGPVSDITVRIQGTDVGTVTDFDGNYSISAKTGDVILFSHISYSATERVVGSSNVINITLSTSGNDLEEVIITAQGIKREKKTLGYAVTSLKGEVLEQKSEGDIARVLQGKIAGVNITPTGGMAGSGTSVSIRSQLSVDGNNQPLYIIDGVPFNSGTNQIDDDFTGVTGGSSSSRSLDIDPNNIETMSVLKGLSATVLYGNEGRNGVILITTKNGSTSEVDKKFEITVTQSNAFSKIANLPDYQNKYGGGADLNYNNGYVGTWGAEFDPNVLVSHNYDQAHIVGVFPEYSGLLVPYQPVKDNVKNFFNTGFVSTTSVNAGKSNENSGFNFNYGKTGESGFIPENRLSRESFGVGGHAKLLNNFTFNGTFNFVKTKFSAPPISAGNGGNFGSSIFARTLFIPRNLDINNLPFQNPVDGSSIYYRTDQDNPRWLLANAGSTQNVNRFFGKVGVKYKLSEKLNVSYRLGLDSYTETQEAFSNKGGTTVGTTDIGFLRQSSGVNNIIDHSLILSSDQYMINNNIGFNFVIGSSARRDTYDLTGLNSTGQVVFDFLDNGNFENGSAIQDNSEQNIVGLYSQVELDFYKTFYLTLAARNDWTSTLESQYNSQFYPSLSLSFLPTKAFEGLKGKSVNFLKLRGGFATSAGFPGPYNTRPRLNTSTISNGGIDGAVTTQAFDNLLSNPNLKPELHQEIEIGLEGTFFNKRVVLDLSLYTRESENQILRQALPSSTGFTGTFVNVGRIDTEGIEVGLTVIPFKNDNFEWNINSNFTAYESIVKELPEGNERIQYSGFSNLGNYAIVDQPLGVIIGSYALRDENGNYLIDYTDGTVIDSDTDAGLPDKIIGDPNPDWKTTLINSFSYKGLTLSGQLEYTHGGDIYSLSSTNLWRRGVTTANISDREGAVVLPGTLANATTGELVDANGIPLATGDQGVANTIPITVNSIYFINTVDNSAESVYDGSVIRLREISLSYELPKRLIEKTPFGAVSFKLSGQNLWYDAVNFPDAFNYDPEILSTGVGNGAGLEFGTAPSSKKYGLSVKLTF